MAFWEKIQGLSIRLKLLYSYLIAFFLVIVLGNTFLYIYVRETIEDNIESELRNATSTILYMARAAVNASITNHLRATAEKNFEIVSRIYTWHQQGKYSEAEAKTLAAKILSSQTIGRTGYIYCIDSSGVMRVHPEEAFVGQDLSRFDFVNQQKQLRSGYLEYEWGGTGEEQLRPKALYMKYFGPWDWIISASSYRDEFNTLIQKDDLKQSILSIKFGETGYSYVMDSKGNLLIHPLLEGRNVYHSEDSDGHKFIQEMCKRKNGIIIYPWQNPGELVPREKLVFFNYIEELDWIIASSSYLEEFYKPLKTVSFLIFASAVLMFAIILLLSWLISTSITKPLHELMVNLNFMAKGDFSRRLQHEGGGELGQVAAYFNGTMDQLEESTILLHESEKNFRSIFENSVEGIFQLDSHGSILNANPSFASMVGFDSIDSLLRAKLIFQRDVLVDTNQWEFFLKSLLRDTSVKSFELQVLQQNNQCIWCMLNARVICDEKGSVERIEGFLSDINALKLAQQAQSTIQEELEQRVELRTAELSGWVTQLELRDVENKRIHEMSDMLQACSTISETFPIINQYLSIIYPGDDYCLYLFDASQQVLDRCVPPVTEAEPLTSVHPDDCWALRQGKPYMLLPGKSQLLCAHVDPKTDSYICIPLLAHGVTTGLMHFEIHTGDAMQQELYEEVCKRKFTLGIRLAEHLSLTLANLKLREELEQLSLKDSLTGLSNRRHMDEILRRQFFRQQRHGVPFSILMLDIDHFKSFNDTYGHEVGDDVLKVLGKHLGEHSRGEDLACRYGGEEFVLILAATDRKQAHHRANQLLREVTEQISIPHGAQMLQVTISIGVATCPEHGDSADALLKSADNALYAAKENGRNRVEVAG